MKTLQKQVRVLYRFRCARCKSQFEMTSEEKLENDWKFDDRKNKDDLREKGFPSVNPMNYFDCPICNSKQLVKRCDMHKIAVMDDNTEVVYY